LSQRNPATAADEYALAVHYQPRRAAYHVAVALTATQLGNFVQAERSMQTAIALRPTDPVLYTQLAAIYGHEATELAGTAGAAETMGKAYRAYEEAIALAPTIALTYQQYADVALRAGDGERALREAQRAVDLDATDGIAFGILGWAHLQEGNLAAALDAFAQAVRWQPGSADFHLGLATVYAQQGNFTAARQAVQQSLALDPTYLPALTLMVQLPE